MPASNTTGVFTATDVYDRAINDMWVTSGFFGDPNFNNTVLLLFGNGTNNANNSVFIDSSNNTFPITKNGNTPQGAFSPYGGKWATRFSGQNYVSTPAHSDYDITGGDFTIEFWINWEKGNTMASSGFNVSTNFVSTVGWDLSFGSTSDNITSLTFQTYNAGWTAATNTAITDANLKRNTWNHLAVVRTGGAGFGILTFYLNGVATGGTFSAPTYPGAGNDLHWGIYAQNYTYSGNPTFSLSNFRIVKGRAVYTKNFTPPVKSLTNDTNTTLLTHNNNRFTNTANALTSFTPAGTPFPEITKFGSDTTVVYNSAIHGGSAYFDGTGDYLTVPGNAAFALGTGSFTVEAWIYPTSAQGVTLVSSNYDYSTGSGNWAFYFTVGSASTIYFNAGTTSGFTNHGSSTTVTIPTNAWTHLVYSRYGGNGYFYINGSQLGTAVADTSNYAGSNPLYIGRQSDGTSPFLGYITDFKIIKGTAVYTGNFTPPTAPLLVSGTSSIYSNTANVNTAFASSDTSLLCNFTNAGITNSSSLFNLETQTNAKISTTQFNSGGSSMFFDGSSTLSIPYTPLLNFGSSNFTIEFWTYVTATPSAEQYFLSAGPAGGGSVNRGWRMGAHNGSAAGIYFYAGGIAGNAETLLGSFPSINAWHHIAIVRNGTTITGYVNGTALGTTINASTTAITDIISGDYSFVGALQGTAPAGRLFYNGYIDDLRITKGVARYTANFTLQNPSIFPNFYAPN